jgi:molybdopterin synthase catalytic subunit
MSARFGIVEAPLALDPLIAALEREARSAGEGCGALCTFLGVVRATHKGRRVTHLDYEAYAPMAVRVFARIAAEAQQSWPDVLLAIHHRVGRLAIGEASVAIVAASAHRAEAFRAARYAIERVKQIAPIWKHEFFEDGDDWVEGALADPEDDDARRMAMERACA